MSWPYSSAPDRPFEPVQSIALNRAQLCEDCHMITEANNNHCRVCNSHSVINLAKVLNREGKNV